MFYPRIIDYVMSYKSNICKPNLCGIAKNHLDVVRNHLLSNIRGYSKDYRFGPKRHLSVSVSHVGVNL